jgi:hypothetical protein
MKRKKTMERKNSATSGTIQPNLPLSLPGSFPIESRLEREADVETEDEEEPERGSPRLRAEILPTLTNPPLPPLRFEELTGESTNVDTVGQPGSGSYDIPPGIHREPHTSLSIVPAGPSIRSRSDPAMAYLRDIYRPSRTNTPNIDVSVNQPMAAPRKPRTSGVPFRGSYRPMPELSPPLQRPPPIPMPTGETTNRREEGDHSDDDMALVRREPTLSVSSHSHTSTSQNRYQELMRMMEAMKDEIASLKSTKSVRSSRAAEVEHGSEKVGRKEGTVQLEAALARDRANRLSMAGLPSVEEGTTAPAALSRTMSRNHL